MYCNKNSAQTYTPQQFNEEGEISYAKKMSHPKPKIKSQIFDLSNDTYFDQQVQQAMH